jgi:hypothetical protein
MAQDTNALINTVAASAADITYSNGNLTIAVDNGTFPTMFVPNIKTFTKVTGVAETSQTSTVTFAAANSTLYELAISQEVGAPNGAPATFIASYTSDSTATEQEIVDAFIDLINSQTGDTGIQVTATDGGASTITLTAQTGFPFFTATAITNMTVAAGVTGVAEQGIGATLAADGVSGATSGTTYTTYIFEYFSSAAAQMGAELNAGLNTLTLYVNQGDADFAAFDTTLRTQILGVKNSTEFGSVTQITSVTTGVTLSVLKGLVTTFTHAEAAGVSAAFTVTNTLAGADSNIKAYVVNYAGTFTTNGLPIVSIDNRVAGAFDIVVSNAHGANALSGVLVIGFEIATA